MDPNPPACSFIHASMAGSRSTAPLNRSNSVLIIARLSAFGMCGYVPPLPSLQQIPRLGKSFVSRERRSRPAPQSFITRIVRDRVVGKPCKIWFLLGCHDSRAIVGAPFRIRCADPVGQRLDLTCSYHV